MFLREVTLRKTKTSLAKGLSVFLTFRALLGLRVQSFGFAWMEIKCPEHTMCVLGRTVQFRAAFGGACTGEAELGAAVFGVHVVESMSCYANSPSVETFFCGSLLGQKMDARMPRAEICAFGVSVPGSTHAAPAPCPCMERPKVEQGQGLCAAGDPNESPNSVPNATSAP